MQKTLLILCFILLVKIAVGDNNERKIQIQPSQLYVPEHRVLTDSIPNAFIDKIDEMYSIWHKRIGGGNFDDFYTTSGEYPTNVPDSVFISRLDSLNSAMKLSYNEIVRNYIELYTNKRRTQVGTMLGLSEYYFPIFEEILDREGLPHELKYLPIIESALNPRAFSRAGASGLWQFMLGTGKMYKLEVNSYIDERRDPIRSSEAAAKFLKDLYNIYEDWILVIAAYNCGPGNVNKAIRRSGDKKNYWDIYYRLPSETRGYVPAFIAAMYVFNYHNEHNISPIACELPALCDTLLLTNSVHFNQISTLLDISIEELRDLNPQYRADAIPAGFGKTYSLKIPYNYVGSFLDRQDAIFAYERDKYFNDSDRLADPKTRIKNYAQVAPSNRAKLVYTVKSGDVIGGIAHKFNVRLADLKYWNGMTKNLINVGQKLTVYVPHDKVEQYQAKIDVKYEGVAANSPTQTEPLIEGEYTLYTIKSGENLWTIAKKFPGVSNRDIMKWNGLTDASVKKLKPGQKLKIKI